MIAPEHTSPNPATAEPLAGWDVIIIGGTRAELLETGEQIQIDPALTAEAGIRWPVYMTSAAHAATITTGGTQDAAGAWHLPHGQDITGRLWDVLNLARYTIKSSPLAMTGAFPSPSGYTAPRDTPGPESAPYTLKQAPSTTTTPGPV